MLINNQVFSTNSINFQGIPRSDFYKVPRNIQVKIQNISDIDKAEGYIIGETKEGILLSIVVFCEEYFPYENSVSFHSVIISKTNKYMATISLLTSYLYILKLTNIRTLISRHGPEHLDTLFMLLNLGFEVREFSYISSPHILVEKRFNKKFNNGITIGRKEDLKLLFHMDYGSKKFYKKKTKKDQRRYSNDPTISNLDLKILSNWYEISGMKYPIGLNLLDELYINQPSIRSYKILSSGSFIYFLQNIEMESGVILCSPKVQHRHYFLSLFDILQERSNLNTIYTRVYNDFINSVIFLSGYRLTTSMGAKTSNFVYKWEKKSFEVK